VSKYFLIIILLLIILNSCSMTVPDNNWYDIPDNLVPTELNNSNIDYQSVFDWVIKNTEYIQYANGFHPVKKTLSDMFGNCANRSILEIALYYKITGKKANLIFCYADQGNGVAGLHYTSSDNDTIYEKYVTKIYYVIEFDNIAGYIYGFQGL
jgi:hypothetical protein